MSFRRHLLMRKYAEKELPYIELDYIESTGTQYIDTGFIPTSKTKSVVDMQCTDWTTMRANFFGSGDTVNNARFNLGMNTNKTHFQWNIANQYFASVLTKVTDRVIITMDAINHKLTIGSYEYTNDAPDYSLIDNNTKTFWLFAGNGAFNSYCKIFSCKIYDDNVLVLDLIPCIRKSDGEVCMYDKVSKSFLDNQGTGDFIAGTLTHLPEGYGQVDYLSSTGTQYFNTEFSATKNNITLQVYLADQEGSSQDTGIIGNLYTAKTSVEIGKAPTFYGYSRTGPTKHDNTNDTLTSATKGKFYNVKLVCDYTTNKKYIYVDGVNPKTIGTYACNFETDSSEPFTVFASGTGTAIKKWYGYMTYAKIVQNDICERFMFSMIDNVGTPCMYDVINDVTYYNVGTGNFTYGRVVKRAGLPEGFQELEYLESTGTQYINTGYIPNTTTKIVSEVAFTETSSDLQQFGMIYNVGSNTYARWHFGVYQNKLTVFRKNIASGGDIQKNFDTNFHRYEITNTSCSFDDEISNTTQVSNYDASFTLFARNGNTTAGGAIILSAYAKAKAKAFKIYENGTLIMDLIPCLNSNGRPCMYDTINYITYYNLGEGEFLYGIKEPTNNLIKETMLGFPSGTDTSISVNSTYPYSYYMNDIKLELGKTYEINIRYVRTPSTTDDGTVRFRMLNEDGTWWGAPASGTYETFFNSIELSGKVGATTISIWFSFQKAILKPKKTCYIRPLVILGTKAKTPPCAYFVDIKEI